MICTSQLHTTDHGILSPGLVLSYVNSVFYYYVMCMLLFPCGGNNGVYCFFIYLGVLLQGLVVKYVIF